MAQKHKTVEIIGVTRVVPVCDKETLTLWLNQELEDWTAPKRDGGRARATVGTKALDLIEAAGFKLVPPVIP